MKSALTLILVFSCSLGTLQSQDNVNAINYYAVSNSLDGQPMVDMINILRFFPVFAIRDSVKAVNVSVYYGSKTYSREAEKRNAGQYWQAMLPEFQLGEAIQRYDVEVGLQLDSKYRKSLENQVTKLEQQRQSSKQSMIELDQDYEESDKRFRNKIDSLSKKLQLIENEKDKLIETFKPLSASLESHADRDLDSIRQSYLDLIKVQLTKNNSGYQILLSIYHGFVRERVSLLRKYRQTKEQKEQADFEIQRISVGRPESIRDQIIKEIRADLQDTAYSGPSIVKSDIIVEPLLLKARILYRNYKRQLRELPALDPAEKLGIFRLRYVPFPVVGKTLRRPLGDNSVTVFEVGLGFGDAVFSGDDFVKPTFSARRLGVAFALTQRFFAEDAEVIALALTYEFNSYGSVGVGLNFARANTPQLYTSIGINQRAFQSAINGLAGIFKGKSVLK